MIFLLKTGIAALREIKVQQKYIEATIIPYLAELEQKHKGAFPAYQRRKITAYYSLLVPVILCMPFRRLYGQPFTEADRWSASMTGLITPLFDDVFDTCRQDITHLKELMLFPNETEADTFSTSVLKEVNQRLVAAAFDPVVYTSSSKAIFETQIETLKQFDPGISKEEIERITFLKGGNSFIFYHTHMMGLPDPAVAEVFYVIGGLHQVCNDLLDIHKDTEAAAYTLANTSRDFTAFKHFFLEKIRIQNQKIRALPFSRKNKKLFTTVMQSIEARGLVAIDYFIGMEKKYGKGLDWRKFSRKELVIDFEKRGNMLRWIYNAWRISRI